MSDNEVKDLRRLVKTGLRYTKSGRYLRDNSSFQSPANKNRSPEKLNCAINLAPALAIVHNQRTQDQAVKKLKASTTSQTNVEREEAEEGFVNKVSFQARDD